MRKFVGLLLALALLGFYKRRPSARRRSLNLDDGLRKPRIPLTSVYFLYIMRHE
jgi:hypothetical protein